MKFSTRSTYGLRAMIKLAENWGEGCLSLSSIADEENISLGYLERLFASLKKSELVKAEKGASGGYRLAQSPDKINLLDIIKTLEGDLTTFYCLDEKGKIFCDEKCRCGVAPVLSKVQKAVINTLKAIKLNELIG